MENNSVQYTFWELIKNYKVVIPIIQRDYAQGRKTRKVTEIRTSFLSTLHDRISKKNKSIDLDFVYGSIKLLKNSKNESEDVIFTPLDGQQRLTTLFLLHWYLARDENGKLSDEYKKRLKNFTYETRTSSKEFCRDLIANSIKIGINDSAKEKIINSPWFFLSWQKDPTIKSMLTMIEDIHNSFQENRNVLFTNLIEERPITFQFLQLNNFGLTDSLYIKMNARGKPLTEFENFKAKFEQFLESKNSIKTEGLHREFSLKIDRNWTDFFWKHRENLHIDNALMRYFLYITEMLYYKNNTEQLDYSRDTPLFNFEQIQTIYSDSKNGNIKFLFKAFDLLCKLDSVSKVFEELFTKNTYEEGRTSLFSENIQLLKKCIEGEGFGIFEKVLFFAILQYMIQNNTNIVDDILKDKLRVLRNILLRVRQRNQTKFNSNLRYEYMSGYVNSLIKLIDNDDISSIQSLSGFSQESLHFEKEKKELINKESFLKTVINEFEDNLLLQGAIHNIDLFSKPEKSKKYLEAFKEIWSIQDNSLIIRSLLTIGDYSISTGWSNLGHKWYFGRGENWHTILTYADEKHRDELKSNITNLIDQYIELALENPIDKLNAIVNNWLEKNSEKDWLYYFIKYPTITANHSLFIWRTPDSSFEIRSLTGNSLRAWHINPYIQVVCERCGIEAGWGKNSEATPLILDNCEVWSIEDGWHVYMYDGYTLNEKIRSDYDLESKIDDEGNEYFLLKEMSSKDRIETAIEFINAIK